MYTKRIIQTPAYALAWVGFSVLIFDVALYLMATLPGSVDYTCLVGGNLTLTNILFSIVLSLGVGLLVTMVLYSLVRQVGFGTQSSVLGLLGSLVSFLTLFCGICSFSLISMLVVTVSFGAVTLVPNAFLDSFLEFTTDYDLLIKMLGLLLVGLTIWLLDRRMQEDWSCRLPKRKKTTKN
ncbi:hypothetical protein COW46_01485 [Candidatus Gracilibacteria bacterium CG17_big_fil_post_rev_8_21_14_2_50_48_13]|nr:MAG: hypothetical protein COW46_01485 [Candidatus Gracilibacteria bacterium CG17_big_fil_post_rev_8_21_14_2_50_48_13]